jgi:protein TonB
MKKLPVLILVLSFLYQTKLSAQQKQTLTQASELPCFEEVFEVIEKDGVWQKSGLYVKKGNRAYTKGKIIEKGSFKNNLREGFWIIRNSEGKFHQGEKVGVWIYKNADGKIVQKYEHTKNSLIYSRDENYLDDFTDTLGNAIKLDRKPVFIGGAGEMYASGGDCAPFYPKEAVKNRISGKVIVKVKITESGQITEEKILTGIGYGCDEEALRCARAIPDNFLPAETEGKKTTVYCLLIFNFYLLN